MTIFQSHLAATSSTDLDRRARHRAVRAVHAAIAWFGFQHGVAGFAFVKPLAGVGRHDFGFAVAALRTSQGRIRDHRFHFLSTHTLDG